MSFFTVFQSYQDDGWVDSLTLLRTPVSAIFVYSPKKKKKKKKRQRSYRHAALHFGGNVYPFTMPGPSGELMTTEN